MPDLPWAATIPNAIDLSLYPCKPHRGDYLLFLGPVQPGQGRAPGDRGRDGARTAAEAGGQEPRAEGAPVLRRVHRAAPRSRRDRVPGGGDARREGRAPPGRARDALPDRVGGAVRPRHGRVDGVRDAGDRDPLRRGARGDRARAERHHRRQLPPDGRGARAGGRARPVRVPALRRGALRPRADGRRLRADLPRGDREREATRPACPSSA